MLKINFLHSTVDTKARRATILVAIGFTLFVGCIAAIGANASYRSATRGTTVLSEVGNFFVFSNLQRLVLGGPADANSNALATPDNRLNILLLGIGGAGHDGPQLTDTIIIASLDTTTNKLGLVSVPRDLAYPLGGGRFEKINAVNANFEAANPGQGASLTAEAFSKQFNVRIDRVVKIDFAGFEEFINALGGIDVNIENTFTDPLFPTEDDGPNPFHWVTVTFTKGPEHMDGKRVLTYVRSRHGTNGEGSDFARSRRQQIVLKAVRERLLSMGTLSNPKTMTDLWGSIADHLETTLSAWDMLKLLPVAARFSTENMTTHVLTDDPKQGQLVSGTVDGSFLLFPKKSDWSEIRAITANPFTAPVEFNKQAHATEPIGIELLNGTLKTGLAAQVSDVLDSMGYTVVSTGNATKRGFERTVIYDLTNGKKPTELARLKKLLDANVSTTAPTAQGMVTDGLIKERVTTSTTNFLIILGTSSQNVTSYASNTNP